MNNDVHNYIAKSSTNTRNEIHFEVIIVSLNVP